MLYAVVLIVNAKLIRSLTPAVKPLMYPNMIPGFTNCSIVTLVRGKKNDKKVVVG